VKYFQETTDWGDVNAKNHIYYLCDDKTKMVGYIKYGTTELFKFKQPIPIYTKGRTFVELKTKGEPDSVYFVKSSEFKPKEAIVVKGSNGKEYYITKIGHKYSCTCPGFQFRHVCKHVTELKV
jgi:hypothetical protein